MRVKAVYLAIGITMDGEKEVSGLWLAQTEGAKFWLQVVTELRNRGVQDIFIACVDDLKGFPDAIEAVFPKTTVQLAPSKKAPQKAVTIAKRENASSELPYAHGVRPSIWP